MKKIFYFIYFIVFFCCSLMLVEGESDSEKARKIVEKIDELYRSNTSKVLIEMNIITPYWQRTLKISVFSQGMKKTFMRILEPKKEMGMATLRIGNDMWNYLPNTNKIIKIPPSMMMGSWMGSDFTNDDLVKEFTFLNDYDFAMYDEKQPEPGIVYVKCVPKENVPVVWGYVILAVRESDYLPVWEKYYNEKGELEREILFKEVKNFGGRTIPALMELIPVKKEGQRTTIRYLEAQFDLPLDADIFSLRNLRTTR